jgi:CRISPR-associated protein Csx17
LSPEWVLRAYDGTAEFRVAAAVASIQGVEGTPVGPLRSNIESASYRRGQWYWSEDKPSRVWQSGDLVQNLDAVLQRRVLDSRMDNLDETPLRGRIGAILGDITAFLEGRLDDRRIGMLIPALTAVDWHSVHGAPWMSAATNQSTPPLPYALLKLVHLPGALIDRTSGLEIHVPPDPSILPLLHAGRQTEALKRASARLRSSGLAPLADATTIPTRIADRLAAAVLVPIPNRDISRVAAAALRTSAGFEIDLASDTPHTERAE